MHERPALHDDPAAHAILRRTGRAARIAATWWLGGGVFVGAFLALGSTAGAIAARRPDAWIFVAGLVLAVGWTIHAVGSSLLALRFASALERLPSDRDALAAVLGHQRLAWLGAALVAVPAGVGAVVLILVLPVG